MEKLADFSARKNHDFFKKLDIAKNRQKSGNIGKHRQTSGKNREKSGKIGKNRQIGGKIGKQILTLLKYKICIF